MKLFSRLITGLPALLLIGTAAVAHPIAVHIHQVNKRLALEILLSDGTKAESEVGPSECEKKGMRRVFLQVADALDDPHAQPMPPAAGMPITKGYGSRPLPLKSRHPSS